MQEPHPSEEVWDKKKIFIAAVILGLFLGVGTYSLIDSAIAKRATPIKGITVDKNRSSSPTEDKEDKKITLPTADDIKVNAEKRFEDIRKEIESINIIEIASSSPQIQKIIKDLKSLEQYPKNQTREMCENICKSI